MSLVANIQRFSIHDGPGIRTTVFLKGCPLHCFWCHNRETWEQGAQVEYNKTLCIGCKGCEQVCGQDCHTVTDKEVHRFDSRNCIRCMRCVDACPTAALSVYGKELTAEEIVQIAKRDKAFYVEEGGITLSGGEPLLDAPFAIRILQLAKREGLNTCVQTSGVFGEEFIPALCEYSDTIMWDLKDTHAERLFANTGARFEQILNHLKAASKLCTGKIVLRSLLLKGINDNEEHIQRLVSVARECGIQKVQLLRYNPLSCAKSEMFGFPPPGWHKTHYILSDEDFSTYNELLQKNISSHS